MSNRLILPDDLRLRAFNKEDNSFYYLEFSEKLLKMGMGAYGWVGSENVYPMQSVFNCDFWEKSNKPVGLPDSEGTLIYEGDIIKVYGKIGQILFDQRGCYFGLKISENETWGFSMNFMECPDLKIIGNIYENSELLEVQK